MKESFRRTIQYFDEVAITTANMVEFAEIMEYPIAATEQYSKALGKTVDELENARKYVLSDKTQFSMITPEVQEFLDTHAPT